MYTSVAEGYDTVAGQHLGVATLIRVDLTESVRKIELPESVAGRVLALLVEGLGSSRKTLHVNVYQLVNSKDNYEGMRAVLDNVYALARWANAHGHNMI
eukprot:3849361-Rhodomonas_salina.1